LREDAKAINRYGEKVFNQGKKQTSEKLELMKGKLVGGLKPLKEEISSIRKEINSMRGNSK
jgi:hypothetical protein